MHAKYADIVSTAKILSYSISCLPICSICPPADAALQRSSREAAE
jgi:hypothetical protein